MTAATVETIVGASLVASGLIGLPLGVIVAAVRGARR